jgi:serine/threonine protein kinase
MNDYIEQFTESLYTIPIQLVSTIHQPHVQIVAAWYIIHTETKHTHLSLQSVRESLCPTCEWDKIGTTLNTLFQIHSIPEDLQLLQTIGDGNTVVVLGHYHPESIVAIKQQIFSQGSWEISSHMIHEMICMKKVASSPWSPRILFQQVSEHVIQIGMEFIPLSFRQMIRFGHPRNLMFIRRIMLQLLHTVQDLHHTHHFAHRDIKPDNIRFRSDGSLVLIDYDSCVDVTSNYRFTNRVCTTSYRDPFLFHATGQGHTYDYFHLDAFSCGCVFLFTLLGGKHAFEGKDETNIYAQMVHYLDDDLSRLPTAVVNRLKLCDRQILKGLLCPDPITRMTVSQAIDVWQHTE